MEKSQDDVVIVGAYRTAITKAKRGAFSHLKNNEILYEHLRNTLEKIGIAPSLIDYVCLGNVLSEMNGTVDARHACLRAGLSIETPVMTVNRQCASGLETYDLIKNMILLDKIEIGLAGGFESMTMHALPLGDINDHGDSEMAKGCLLSMIETAEKIASVYGLSREAIDDFAFESHARAFNAVKNKHFSDEILPLLGISTDDCVRDTSRERMASCRTVSENGTVTAANASQLSDGCALGLLMKRKTAEKYNLKIQGVFIDYAVVGVDPSVMGIGPAVAVPRLLKQNDLGNQNISAFEINEAFGSQALYCQKMLGIPCEKLNIKGGSIAYGHPLGCTGARLVCTLLNNLAAGELGVVSLCTGTGHGVAALILKE